MQESLENIAKDKNASGKNSMLKVHSNRDIQKRNMNVTYLSSGKSGLVVSNITK